jgi:hypothetical protein
MEERTQCEIESEQCEDGVRGFEFGGEAPQTQRYHNVGTMHFLKLIISKQDLAQGVILRISLLL